MWKWQKVQKLLWKKCIGSVINIRKKNVNM